MNTNIVNPYQEKYVEDIYFDRDDNEPYRRIVLVKARNKEEALECLNNLITSINEDTDFDSSIHEWVLSMSLPYTLIEEEENSHEDTGDISQTLREAGE